MNTQIEPHELSGLLDGEIAPERAGEIRRAIDNDAALRAEFDRLAQQDQAWAAAASRASFRPRINLPTAARAGLAPILLATSLAILAVRFLPKMTSQFALAMSANAVALAAILALVFWINRQAASSRSFADIRTQ